MQKSTKYFKREIKRTDFHQSHILDWRCPNPRPLRNKSLKALFASKERDCQKVGDSYETSNEARTSIQESTKWENC